MSATITSGLNKNNSGLPIDQIVIDPLIVLAIADGDEKAFGVFFDLYSPRVMQTALRFTHSNERAQDILQDVFLKIWLKRTELPAIANLENWVFIITRNYALSALTRQARIVLSGETMPDHIPVPETLAESKLNVEELGTMIHDAIKRLPPQQQRVFELAKIKHMSREEVAAEMGISPNTVKTHLFQATKSIRAYLLTRMEWLPAAFLLHYFF